MESKITQDFKEDSAKFFNDRSEYESVEVLLLYWKDGDLEVEGELIALRRLFEKSLKFLVASYPIPGDGTQKARLRTEIANFVERSALRRRSLIIIYYTGHCRETDGQAEWSA